MPGRTETALYESGRATAPPGVRYNIPTGPSNEGYTHTVAPTTSANLAEQIRTASIQSPQYTPNYSNFAQQRAQASPRCTPAYSPCPSPSPNYSLTSKVNASLPSQSPQYIPSYSSSSHIYSSSFGSSSFSSYNSSNSNFDLPSTSSGSTKSQQSSCLTHENNIFPSSEHISSTLFNIPKSTKTNSNPPPRYSANYSNFSYFSNNQPKHSQNKSNINSDFYGEKQQKSKSDFFVIPQKIPKICKDETEFNCNIGDLQQFLSKHGSKIKNSSETSQDSVTDSFLNFLQRKTYEKSIHDSFPCESNDINQVLVSICNKEKSEEVSDIKKRETGDESKSVNDFMPKIFSEKEEKRCRNVDDRKKSSRKEILDDLSLDCEEKKNKRDAMSHYQDDKTHKRPPSYGDFNQWDYLNAQDIQTSSNHNRRGIPFCGSSQTHSVAWNPMNMPHQTNPYYSSPHGHVLPAHAHTEYRYNQWNNPNHKNVTNIQNAHSQNAVLNQTKLDMKHGATQNSVQDFGLQMNSDYSKLRNSPHDMVLRTPTPENASRSLHSDYSSSMSPTVKNSSSSLRTPPPATSHSKTVVGNPLSDLQVLVTNQDTDKAPEKSDVYQQESVDLSAHSENIKQKEVVGIPDDKSADVKVVANKDSRSTVPVTQPNSKETPSENDKVVEKPVELTAKSSGKSDQCGEKEISSTFISVSSAGVSTPKDQANAKCESDELSEKEPEVDAGDESKASATPKENSLGSPAAKDKVEELSEENTQKKEANESDAEKMGNNDVNSQNEGECDFARILKRLEDTETDNADKEDKIVTPNKLNEINTLENLNEVPATSSNEDLKEAKPDKSPEKDKSPDEKSEPENKKLFMEVESELQKMFGNVGEENSDLPTVSSTSVDVKPSTSDSNKKTPRKRPSRTKRSARLSSAQSSGSENLSHKKKSKGSKSKEDSKKKVKRNLFELDFSKRGPVLHVEGSRESPSSVIVVNFPKGDDEDEKEKSSAKKQISSSSKNKHHNELDYNRGRSKNGLFSSTLSARYDAQSTDYSWICVFCKKGPHYNSLGDLFGPYIISKDENNSLCEFSGDEKDITDAQKRGGRNKKSIRANNMVDHFQKMSKKLRRCQSGESCLTGMTIVSDDQVDQLRYEVWVHEQCAIWSPNVCLIGSRIIGMQEAIWLSVKTMCSKCGVMGANIGCVHRNCPNRSHYICAKESGWSLQQENFISTCHIHKPKS